MTFHAPRTRVALRGALAAVVLAASCVFQPREDPTRFWVLTASVRARAPESDSLAVGLGPIEMPGYLQQPMLATRIDGTQIRYAEFDRWAEPLPVLFARALGHDLSALLGAHVVAHPWYRAAPLDVATSVDVTCFEADAEGNARLDACWTVRSWPTKAMCGTECSSIVERVDGSGAGPQVNALGRAVSKLAERLSSAIRGCSQTSERSGRRAGRSASGPPITVAPGAWSLNSRG